jgi:hypothetical protein
VTRANLGGRHSGLCQTVDDVRESLPSRVAALLTTTRWESTERQQRAAACRTDLPRSQRLVDDSASRKRRGLGSARLFRLPVAPHSRCMTRGIPSRVSPTQVERTTARDAVWRSQRPACREIRGCRRCGRRTVHPGAVAVGLDRSRTRVRNGHGAATAPGCVCSPHATVHAPGCVPWGRAPPRNVRPTGSPGDPTGTPAR